MIPNSYGASYDAQTGQAGPLEDRMSDFSDFTEKDYQSYINLLRLAFDAVLNAETLEDAKHKAQWAAEGQIHSGYGAFEIVQAQKQYAALESQLAESQRREELLRALYERHKHLDTFLSDETLPPIGRTGSAVLYELWEFIKQAAIDGGAMGSQWQQATDKLLTERHDLWQQMAARWEIHHTEMVRQRRQWLAMTSQNHYEYGYFVGKDKERKRVVLGVVDDSEYDAKKREIDSANFVDPEAHWFIERKDGGAMGEGE